MNLSYNCHPGSAWHTWQKAGREWREKNPTLDPLNAATDFALYGASANEQRARQRAFIEGAKSNKTT